MTPNALRALADAAEALARLAREAAEDVHNLAPGRMLSLTEAAAFAAVTRRSLNEAIRRGELAAFGRQRDRSVKGADLLAWIESRRYRSRAVVLDDEGERDLERRMRRIELDGTSKSDPDGDLEPLRRRLMVAASPPRKRRAR